MTQADRPSTWSTQITDWQLATFGPVQPGPAWARFEEELEELIVSDGLARASDENASVAEEAADVVITLAAWVLAATGIDLAAAVERKLQTNRAREWVLDGRGCGYRADGARAAALLAGRTGGAE